MIQKVNTSRSGWLIFFYSVPSKPVNARMKIWRRLSKAGAVQLKGAVYLLPYSEENYELCQWLISEVVSVKGDGSFVAVDGIETMKEHEIMDLFNLQRERDYTAIEKAMEELERKMSSAGKGTGIQSEKKFLEQFNKLQKEFEEIRKIDFYTSRVGLVLRRKFEIFQREIQRLLEPGIRKTAEVLPRHPEAYQDKTWATRTRPFVDRMASAWLIRRFIDNKAGFKFIDEKDLEKLEKDIIAFDIRDGGFTHVGEMCTLEVLIKTFGLKDKRLKSIAAIVHELDIKDEKYKNAEAKGIEDILMGIRKTAKDDMECLEKGMAVFEMLYASRT